MPFQDVDSIELLNREGYARQRLAESPLRKLTAPGEVGTSSPTPLGIFIGDGLEMTGT
jgi:hypothetical protein